MKPRFNEKTPLMGSSDLIIQIDEEDKISLLPQEIINIISSYLAYNAALANLRRSSARLNCLVENTKAGRLARDANDLHPFSFSIWLATNSKLIEKMSVVSFGAGGGAMGIGAGIYTGIVSVAAGGEAVVGISLGVFGSILGGGCGIGLSGLLGSGIAYGVSKFSIFTENKMKEVDAIHKELEQPIPHILNSRCIL